LDYRHGSSLVFIGVLTSEDVTVGENSIAGIPSLVHWNEAVTGDVPQPALDTSRTTPDGTTIAFESKAQLTSYDNAGQREIYRYKIGESAPTCVSCDRNGQPPSAGAHFLRFYNNQSPRHAYP